MDQQNPTLAKIPILDTGKFQQWQFRIQQYHQHEHYALWEVIEFGDSYEVPANAATTSSASDETGKKKGRTITLTTDDMQKRKNDVKARTTLLLSLPDEHQLRFSKYKTAQELWAAILKTFGGNEATKKMKKNLLKQQYGNFKAEGSKTLEHTFNRLQVIVSQLQFINVEIEQGDLNQKFLTSLAPEWLMHTIVWRNRSDLDTMSLDDLYNHLKVYESEVQNKLEPNSQNMAFISSAKHIRGDEKVNTASVSTTSTNVPTASANIGAASISQDAACAYIASQSSGKKISIQGIDVTGFDKSKVECFNCHKMGHFARECRAPRSQARGRKDNYRQGSKVEEQAPKALMAIDGVGWDWSYMANDKENHALIANEETPTEFALMAKTTSEIFDNSLCFKASLAQVESRLAEHRSRELKYCEKIRILEFKIESRIDCIENLKKELELIKKEKKGLDSKLTGFQTASKDLDNLLERLSECADDTVTDYSRPAPTIESFSDDAQNRNPSVTETKASPSTISPKPFIKFVKANDSPTKSKTYKVKTAKKPPVKKRVKRGISRSQNNTHKSFTPITVVHRPYRPPIRPTRPNMNAAQPNRTSFNKPPAHSYNKRPFQKTSAVRSQYRAPWVPTVNRNFPPVNRKFSTVSRNFSTVNRKLPTANKKISTGGTKFSTADMGKKGKAATYPTSLIMSHLMEDMCLLVKDDARLLEKKLSKPNSVLFTDSECIMLGRDFKLLDDANVLLRTPRQHNMYSIDLNNIVPHKDLTCLVAKASADEGMLWHRRLGHLNFKTMNRLVRHNLVRGLPFKCFENDHTCTACLKGKQHKASWKFEAKGDEGYFIGYSMSSKAFRVFNKRTKKVKENLHVKFLENKAIEKGAGPNWLFDIDSLTKSINYVPVVTGTNSTNLSGTKDAASQEVKKDVPSLRYISLPNWVHDALLETSSSKPQDNCSSDVPESSGNSNPTATSTNPSADQMEILTMETPIPTVSLPVSTAYFTDSQKPSSDTRLISKRVANQVETPSLDNILTLTNRFKDILGVTTNSDESNGVEADVSNMETTITTSPTPTLRIHKDHPKSQIIGHVDTSIQTRNKSKKEELLQFKIQNVWTLVDCPKGVRPIGTKWVLKNKKDERGIVIRNKVRLVAQGHIQEERIDYDEVFAPVARIEAIRLFLAYASFMGFTVYQMDVKSAFLYGTIDEEVYVIQPPGFQDLEFPARVYKVEKAMYRLHQAPRAWYVYVDDIIFGSSNPQLCREFEALMHEKFQMSAMDKYVDDILKKFRYSDVRYANTPMDKENPWGKDRTGKDVDLHLYRSMIGSLMYLTASRPDIMVVVCAYARHQVTPKECHMHAVKRIFRYLKGHPKLGLWYPKESPFDLVAYSDSDYGGATQDCKSTTRGCQFLGRRLISWQCKKQTIVATSTTEAEYVAAASCCGQVLWIQNQLLDYGYNFMNTKIYIDNNSPIYIVKNPVYHSKTKHIEIRHHFIRDCFEKKLISVDHIHTDENVADLLTKPFDAGRFQYLVVEHAMRGSV
nr:hypothetical protein [Tanacetum cinerariifolium]